MAAALKQQLNRFPLRTHRLSHKAAVGGWLMSIFILITLLGSEICAIILGHPLLIIQTHEDLSRAVLELGFKLYWLDTPVIKEVIKASQSSWFEELERVSKPTDEDDRFTSGTATNEILLVEPEMCREFVERSIKKRVDSGICGHQRLIRGIKLFGMTNSKADPKALRLSHRFGLRLLESHVWWLLQGGYPQVLVNTGLMQAANHEVKKRLQSNFFGSMKSTDTTPIFFLYSALVIASCILLTGELMNHVIKRRRRNRHRRLFHPHRMRRSNWRRLFQLSGWEDRHPSGLNQ